jgi:hypothetical protein
VSGPEDIYTSALLKRFGYVATWYPGTPVKLGLIGVMEGKTFIPKSSIRTLGVRFTTTKDASVEKTLQFASSKEVEIAVKLRGAVSDIAPTIPSAKAGVAVSFRKKTGVVLSAKDVAASRISDILALENAIWDLYDRFLWHTDWVVVTEVLTAQAATILVSEGGGAKVELQAVGSANIATVDIGDLAAGFSVVSSRGMHTQIVGETGMTPLFRAVHLAKPILRGIRVQGLRVPAPPPPPGTVPRRGLPRPNGSLTELVGG